MKEQETLHDLEKRLHVLEKTLREVVEYSNSLIVRWNSRGIVYMNPRALQFFGYKPEEIIGKDVQILLPSEEVGQKLAWAAEEIVRDPDKNINRVNENIKKNGEKVWVAWANSAVIDESGNVDIIGVGNDITALKRREETLREREREFKTLVDNASAIIIRWDRNFRILYANPRVADVRGLPPEEYIGKTMDEIAPNKALNDALRRVFETGEKQRIEMTVHTPFGRKIIEQLISPECVDGKVSTVMGIARDITESKQSRRELESERDVLGRKVDERTSALAKAEVELERSKRLSDLGQLAASVAHELRNPLASIKMATFNIDRKMKSEKIAGNIATIEKKIDESNKIIGDILSYGRIKPPEYEPVKIADLVRESLADVRIKRGDEKIRIEDRLDLAGCVIQADSRQLKEVFTNLIDNACDAVKSLQDREGEVRLEGEDLDQDVRIIISDSGVGMDEATLQKLNKPFFTTKSQGTGLGLTVARQIIDLHKGALDIRSEKGRGTSVTVILPKNKS